MKLTLHHLTLASMMVAGLSLAACKDHGVNSPVSSADTTTTTTADASNRDATLARNDADHTQTAGTSGVPMGSAQPDESSAASASGLIDNAPTGAGVPASGVNSASAAALSPAERSFVMEAAQGGQFEVAAARLAADKATDSAVKSYGAMLVTDHTNANQKLQQLASRHGLTLPSSLPADKQKELDKLSQASGHEFDRQFVQMVGLKDHKADISMFEKAEREGKDADLHAFIQTTLPTLKAHLSAAQNLPASVRKSL